MATGDFVFSFLGFWIEEEEKGEACVGVRARVLDS